MSQALDTLLDPQRRAQCRLQDALDALADADPFCLSHAGHCTALALPENLTPYPLRDDQHRRAVWPAGLPRFDTGGDWKKP